MRKIKFRQWLADKKRFHYFEFCDGNIGGVISASLKINPITQFTGLYDKQENEIYEGDVLKCKRLAKKGYEGYDIGEVQFGRLGSFVLYLKEVRLKIPLVNYIADTLCLVEDKDFEVVGNTFENPELLD